MTGSVTLWQQASPAAEPTFTSGCRWRQQQRTLSGWLASTRCIESTDTGWRSSASSVPANGVRKRLSNGLPLAFHGCLHLLLRAKMTFATAFGFFLSL
jgi:hypothetical protein